MWVLALSPGETGLWVVTVRVYAEDMGVSLFDFFCGWFVSTYTHVGSDKMNGQDADVSTLRRLYERAVLRGPQALFRRNGDLTVSLYDWL